MSRFFSDKFNGLTPYVPGEQPKNREYIKLNTNESPFPPCEGVIRALNRDERSKLNLYSDPSASALVEAISSVYGVRAENIAVGNGSDEILAFIFNAFCDQKKGMAFPDITYGFYPVFASMFGVAHRVIPLDKDFKIRIEDYKDIKDNVIIANPNAQTGILLEKGDVEALILQDRSRLVVIDEAYMDFAGTSAVELTKKYDNVIVVQTFSKSRSLAGARVGFAIAECNLINDINTMKYSFNPYNINRLSIIAGREAMLDTDYMKSCVQKVIENREYTKGALEAIGFRVLDSRANFLLAESDTVSGRELYNKLKERGILVRYLGDRRIENFVRITVGNREQMDALIAAVKEILCECERKE